MLARATLWHERQRYLPALLAVAFSAVLVAIQGGLLLGTFALVSIPIDHTPDAHVWIGRHGVVSVDQGTPIPELEWETRAYVPGVVQVEPLIISFCQWVPPSERTDFRPTGMDLRARGAEWCQLVGARMGARSLGAIQQLTPDLRQKLEEPGTVVVSQEGLDRLGLRRGGVGEFAQINGRRVKVVGLISGVRGLQGPYVFAGLDTARRLSAAGSGLDQATFLLVRVSDPRAVPAVVADLRQRHDNMAVYTRGDFSTRSQLHWMLQTGAGAALLSAAVLGLLVGAIITSQTLYAATVAQLREFAVLRAMGIPRWRLITTVLAQSFWVGSLGLAAAVPLILALAWAAASLGASIQLPFWLLGLTGVVTLVVALLSGVAALRSLRQVEPATLLR